MKRAVASALVLLIVLSLSVVPIEAGGRWYGGRGCCWGGWWWPGAFVGGLAVGAAVAATYPPFYGYPRPYYPYSAPYYALPYYTAPYYGSPYYGSPSVVYAPAQTYVTAPPAPPAVQREVVYPHGKYVLYGDGVNQPWQWVWVSATPPPPAPSR